MIGYYIHHRGSGHLHRALAIIAELGEPVTGLSSLPRPANWRGEWVELPLDLPFTEARPVDVRAGGALHWAPLGSAGLSTRMTAVSEWIGRAHPRAVVVDVSVEITVFVRLHGVPVVTFAQPGNRSDAAHSLGYRLSSAIIAPWPAGFSPHTIDDSALTLVEPIGAISRLAVGNVLLRNARQIAVMNGTGGRGLSALDRVVADAQKHLPGYHFVTLDGASAEEVRETLAESCLAFTHCGQNAVAEVAATRTPAILVAEERPHDEQFSLARALAVSDYPVRVHNPIETIDWRATVARLTELGGSGWAEWCDGDAAGRAAAIIERVADGTAREKPVARASDTSRVAQASDTSRVARGGVVSAASVLGALS